MQSALKKLMELVLYLREVKINNFRSYQNETVLKMNDLTALIGRNDAGKSSILDALDAFFNGADITQDDICKYGSEKSVEVTCTFAQFPEEIVIDSDAKTSLKEECLLNQDGFLEIKKVWSGSASKLKEKIFCIAEHPEEEKLKDLLSLKITELRKRATELQIDESSYSKAECPSIRKAIREHFKSGGITLAKSNIEIGDKERKKVWDALQNFLPIYALFRSDRASTDADSEAQDPMKAAVSIALKEVEIDLKSIQEKVELQLKKVTDRTLTELKNISPELAQEIKANLPTPKWNSLFKISLETESGIPINKKGSGTRRLILLSFFKAEVERKKETKKGEGNFSPSVIYAIEEPETSQHPDNINMIIETLQDLSESEDIQVLLTTHVPALAGKIKVDDIRFIQKISNIPTISSDEEKDEEILRDVAATLGVHEDPLRLLEAERSCKVIVCVEGPTDISFLSNVSATITAVDSECVRIDDNKIITIPLGGSNLQHWITNNYLKKLNLPKVYIFDGDSQKYTDIATKINSEDGEDIAFCTSKREIENYIHSAAIKSCSDNRIDITIDDNTDVPAKIKEKLSMKQESKAKKWLCEKATELTHLNYDMIMAVDTKKEIKTWLKKIKELSEL